MIYIFGGTNNHTTMKDLWRFDLTLERWNFQRTLGDFPKILVSNVSILQGNSIFVYNGILNSHHEYHIPTNQWNLIDLIGIIPKPRGWFGYCTYNDSLFIHGGSDQDSIFSDFWKITLPKRNSNLKLDTNRMRKSNLLLDISFK